MPDVQVNVAFKSTGSQAGLKTTKDIAATIASARSDLAKIKASKGIGVLAVGASNVALASAEVENLTIQLIRAGDAADVAGREFAAAVTRGDVEQISRYAAEVSQAESNVAGLTRQLNNMGREVRESGRQNVGYLGDIDTALQTFGTSLVNFGGQIEGSQAGGLAFAGGQLAGLGGMAGQAGDLFAVAEQIPNITNAFSEMQNVSKGLPTLISNSSKAITNLSTSTKLMIGAAGAATIAVVAITAAYRNSQRLNEEALTAEKERLSALIETTEQLEAMTVVERQRARILAESEAESLTNRVDAVEGQLRASAENALESLLGVYLDTEQYDRALSRLAEAEGPEDIIATVERWQARLMRQTGAETEFFALADLLEQTNSDLLVANTKLDIFNNSVEEIGVSSENTADALATLDTGMTGFFDSVQASISTSSESLQSQSRSLDLQIASQQAHIESLEEMASAGQDVALELLEANEELTNLQGSLTNLKDVTTPLVEIREREEQAVRDGVAAVEERIERERGLADLQASLAETATAAGDAIQGINDGLVETIDDLDNAFEKSETKRLSKLNKDLASLDTKTAEKRTAIYTSFSEKSIALNAKFLKDTLASERDNMRERANIIRDAGEALLSAEEDNNVIAFVQAERQRDLALQKQSESADEETREQQAAFSEQSAALKQDRRKQIGDLRRDSEQRRVILTQSYNEQTLELEAALEQQKNDARAAANERIENERAALVQSIIDQKAAHQASLNLQAQAAQQRLQLEKQLSTGLARVATDSYNRAISSIRSGSVQRFSSSSGLSGVSSVNKYTATSKSVSSSPTVNIQANVGSGMSEAAVKERLNQVASSIMGVFGRANASYNSLTDARI